MEGAKKSQWWLPFLLLGCEGLQLSK
jgi:hypothetical protein